MLLSLLLVSAWTAAFSEENVPVFLGARGFGVETPAGRGGKVVRVTTLNTAGPGSFREALSFQGPRIVVFEVGGVIDLNKAPLNVTEPFLTVAGQTAPSPGITLIRGGMTIATHDVLVQHIRVRPGDAGMPKRSGWAPDGIATSGREAYNIVIDHCSISWAVDENLSASGPRTEGPDATSRRITFSNCIIAEGLNDSSHNKGPHSKGSLIHDFCRDIAIIGNLYAHNARRNPYFKAHTTGVIVNNVIYNPGSGAILLGFSPREWENTRLDPEKARVAVVGNVMIHGADTTKGLALVTWQGDAYLEDNMALDSKGKRAPLRAGRIDVLDEKPVWPEGLLAGPAAETAERVTRYAGARPKDRDAVDTRIVREFLERRGQIIDSQEEVGGYPQTKLTRRPLEVPAQGIGEWLHMLALELEE